LAFIIPALSCLLSTVKYRAEDEVKSYEGYQVLRISNVSDERTRDLLSKLYLSDNLFDFLTPPSMVQPTDVLLCPEQVDNVKAVFEAYNVPYSVMISNMQGAIEAERLRNDLELRASDGMNWRAYHRLATIQGWMDSMAEQYPALVSVESYGMSTEGRDMKVLKISTGGSNKPAVWMDGGIHAREWVSPATVTYITDQLISQATSGGEDYKLVSSVDWYIVPNLNPDGYEFSHTRDRMWRKTRSSDGSFAATVFGCVGTDPNRNWSYKWGGKGTSTNPCTQIYKGPKAASEPEVSQTQDYIYARRDQIKLFLTFHSYSQMIFTPWGYDDVPIEDKSDLMEVANAAAEALRAVHGTKYQTGSSPELLYPAAGGSEDYARGVAGIKFSYCYELRDTGDHGFTLPPSQIIPTGEETYASVKAMVQGAMAFHKIEGF
jgi:hypothetical protein